MSFIDLMELNSPRGLFDLAPDKTPQSPTPKSNPSSFDSDFFTSSPISPAGFEFPWGRSSRAPGGFHRRQNCSLSDSLYSTSPVSPENWSMQNQTSSNFNSPDFESSSSSIFEGQLVSDILNKMTLNELVMKNMEMRREWEQRNSLQALQNLQQMQLSNNPMEHWLRSDNSFHMDQVAHSHHRNGKNALYEPICTWSGVLPARTVTCNGFSTKVFLGGLPWDVTEQSLIQTFKTFGPLSVEWPRKAKDRQLVQPRGYVYIIFEAESSVHALLDACTVNSENEIKWYFKMSSRRMKCKDVEVIPWSLSNTNYSKSSAQKLEASKTVFVGALHGMLNAEGLAKIMNDLFDGVVYAGIDTDKYKYPIGSGRVTFDNPRSYITAVRAGFIEIKTEKFVKKLQVDPYLEDSLCSVCEVQQGPYFCRDLRCFRYFCRTCWVWEHNNVDLRHHRPLTRNPTKNQNNAAITAPSFGGTRALSTFGAHNTVLDM